MNKGLVKMPNITSIMSNEMKISQDCKIHLTKATLNAEIRSTQ